MNCDQTPAFFKIIYRPLSSSDALGGACDGCVTGGRSVPDKFTAKENSDKEEGTEHSLKYKISRLSDQTSACPRRNVGNATKL